MTSRTSKTVASVSTVDAVAPVAEVASDEVVWYTPKRGKVATQGDVIRIGSRGETRVSQSILTQLGDGVIPTNAVLGVLKKGDATYVAIKPAVKGTRGAVKVRMVGDNAGMFTIQTGGLLEAIESTTRGLIEDFSTDGGVLTFQVA